MPADHAAVRPIKRALVSVYDKTGLDDLARDLHRAGIELVSTGGSAAVIEGLGIPVTHVEDLTGFPECLDGRVKTLHPRVHAGILADGRKPEHRAQLDDLGVEQFDLVVSNLYPFSETVASGALPDACVEQIDIGGPTMVRAAAKNHPTVAIVTSPDHYDGLRDALAAGGYTLEQRRRLAADAFVHTATYDVHVASWFCGGYVDTSDGDGFPAWVGATWTKSRALRYGENPHQGAAVYVSGHQRQQGLAQGRQLHGKPMSYNNFVDADTACRAAYDQGDRPTCAIIKHANPCGIAVADDIAEAHRRAHACDPLSAFGGIIAANQPVTQDMAGTIQDIFTEVVVAPGFDAGALELLTRKQNIRLLQVEPARRDGLELRPISGGMLLQHRDTIDAAGEDADGHPVGDDPARWRLVAGPDADPATLADLELAWRAVRATKSNAILLAKDGASVGVGMGQVNRVDACRLAVERAGADRARGAVASSDAFFPFADGPQVLIDAGIRAVVAPGGSKRDAETMDVCSRAGVTLYFTGVRHFFH